MPVYDYKCIVCNAQYSQERSIHAEADTPICCGMNMERVWQATPAHFKGGGWGGQ